MTSGFDDLFFTATQLAEGSIETLLDEFFSFLKRRSDFYVLFDKDSDDRGFLPGRAEELVLEAFHRQWHRYDISPTTTSPPPRTRLVQPRPFDTQHKGAEPLAQVSGIITENEVKLDSPPEMNIETQPKLSDDGCLPKLVWKETDDDMTLEFPLNKKISKGSVAVNFGRDWLSIEIPAISFSLVETTEQHIVKAESQWYLETSGTRDNPKQSVVLHLAKAKKGKWSTPFSRYKPDMKTEQPETMNFFGLPRDQQVSG